MALPAIMRKFEISLADSDRNVYEQLELRVAQHPSESERYLVARVIARVLEHGEGVEFSKGGVSDDVEPALVQRDLRGDLLAWIEVGSPTPDRLHKATKLCKRVVVYAWKNPDELATAIVERRTHRAEDIVLVALDPEFLDAAAAKLDRTNKWDLAVTGGALYLTIGEHLVESTLRPISIR
ncbi:MAG: YaeQ family protein [Deltaproteobacteria bacterium]|nr:YaeQ family protein [Deltaproteobacteria bacterium]